MAVKKLRTPDSSAPRLNLQDQLSHAKSQLTEAKQNPGNPRIPILEETIAHLEEQGAGAYTRETSKRMLADLARSGLSPSDATRMGCHPITSAEAKHLGFLDRPGYVMPYFGLDGRRLPPEFSRMRYTDEPDPGSKSPRYGQVKETVPRLYYPPGFDWRKFLVPGVKVTIVEGEKKAVAACKKKIPTIAVGGVQNWRAKRKGFVFAVPDVDALLEKIKGGTVEIVFDSDIIDKPSVASALSAFGQAITKRGSRAITVRLPGKNDLGIENSDDDKIGLDDYLLIKTAKDFYALPREEDRVADLIRKTNEDYTYVQSSSGVWIHDLKRLITIQSFRDLTAAREPIVVTGPSGHPQEQPFSEVWRSHPERGEAARLVFVPGAEPFIMNGCQKPQLNTWFQSVQPRKPTGNELDSYFRIRDHVIEKSEHQWLPWLECWAAYPIQHPGEKLYTAVVVHGVGEGTGKDFLGMLYGAAYGAGYVNVKADVLGGDFNSILKEKEFVHIDEVATGDKRKDTNTLKSLISQETLKINEKFCPEFTIRNVINFYFTSNHEDPIHVVTGARRFFVLRATARSLTSGIGQKAVDKADEWLRSEKARGAMRWYLQEQVDCSKWHPRQHAPETTSMGDMVWSSQSAVTRWLARVINDPDGLHGFQGLHVQELQTANDLAATFNMVDSTARTNEVTIGHALAELRVPTIRTTRIRLYPIKNTAKWMKVTPAAAEKYYHETKLGQGLGGPPNFMKMEKQSGIDARSLTARA